MKKFAFQVYFEKANSLLHSNCLTAMEQQMQFLEAGQNKKVCVIAS